MDVKVSLNNEITVVKNINNKDDFGYYDTDGNFISFLITEKSICINCLARDHLSTLHFDDDPRMIIETKEGLLNFVLKDVAINSNFGIISIVYKIDDEKRSILIEYLGV